MLYRGPSFCSSQRICTPPSGSALNCRQTRVKRGAIESLIISELVAYRADTRAKRNLHSAQMGTRVLASHMGGVSQQGAQNYPASLLTPPGASHTANPFFTAPFSAQVTSALPNRQAIHGFLADDDAPLFDLLHLDPDVTTITARVIKDGTARQSSIRNGEFLAEQRRSREAMLGWILRINYAVEFGLMTLLDKEIEKHTRTLFIVP